MTEFLVKRLLEYYNIKYIHYNFWLMYYNKNIYKFTYNPKENNLKIEYVDDKYTHLIFYNKLEDIEKFLKKHFKKKL
jgi:hypothetical protein